MPEGVRLQNLRDFTVQIRNAKDAIVGTGIAVSMDGKVVTCRHVVEQALQSKVLEGAEVGVYFPQSRGGEQKNRQARVERYFPEHDDDVVLLQLTGGASPLAPEQIAVLGTAEFSEGNPFRTYGYSPIGDYPASRGDGTILGLIERPTGRNLQADPVQLKSRDIAAGMSGAAVLDVTRNLIVGLVAERFYSSSLVQDDIGYGVDSKVLTFDPFEFILRGENLALKPAPEFRLDKDLFAQAVEISQYILAHRKADQKYSWNNAPTVLPEWTGREALLKEITDDWNDPAKHVAGLIGFGGEGKSSLARAWVESVIQSKVESQRSETPDVRSLTFDGLFWWGFYENRSVDEFLEAALKYLGGGRIDPKAVSSSSLRAQIIGAMLGAGKYLFVLDGIEVLQNQEGDQYGLLQSNDLRDLLTYFARPDNLSFCLITSRAPLLDLMDYTTYSHHNVDRLSEADGAALLGRLGVRGTEAQKAKAVSDWDGHALTISLLGSYLAEKHGGDLAHLAELPVPTAAEPRYERVHRVLRRYDEHLTQAEREFLKLFSAFRTPVHEDAFEKVFAPLLGVGATHPGPNEAQSGKSFPKKAASSATGGSPLARLANRLFGTKVPDDRERATRPLPDETNLGQNPVQDGLTENLAGSPLPEMVKRLVAYRLLKHDPAAQTYTTHPLVRNHYLAILTRDTGAPETHTKIKDYYLSIAGDTPTYPTLEDLKPLIEVVHHACQAGAYDEAFDIYLQRIEQGNRKILGWTLGAFDTMLNTMLEFFPERNSELEPTLSEADSKRWILNTLGFCLTNLGRLREAVPCYERSAKIAFDMQDWRNASATYRNLADLHAAFGALDQSAAAARQALDLARKAENKQDERNSLKWQAWANHLIGDLKTAGDAFVQAEKLEQEIDSSVRYLYSLRGIQHANHLRCTGQADYARRVTDANLLICEQNHFAYTPGMCHRVLGDLDSDAGTHGLAREHYDIALKRARSESKRDALIEALLARGRWAAKLHAVGAGLSDIQGARSIKADPPLPLEQAFNNLNEALTYAIESGYRIYEADLRVALGWAHLAVSCETLDVSAKQKAKAEAERALEMSREMGYHWGQVDAREVLGEIGNGER